MKQVSIQYQIEQMSLFIADESKAACVAINIL